MGPSGASVRSICEVTGADIRSFTDTYAGRRCRTMLVEGGRRAVVAALQTIAAAVETYASLCGGAYCGLSVDRQQPIGGVTFYYSPPPRSAVPYAAALRSAHDRCGSLPGARAQGPPSSRASSPPSILHRSIPLSPLNRPRRTASPSPGKPAASSAAAPASGKENEASPGFRLAAQHPQQAQLPLPAGAHHHPAPLGPLPATPTTARNEGLLASLRSAAALPPYAHPAMATPLGASPTAEAEGIELDCEAATPAYTTAAPGAAPFSLFGPPGSGHLHAAGEARWAWAGGMPA